MGRSTRSGLLTPGGGCSAACGKVGFGRPAARGGAKAEAPPTPLQRPRAHPRPVSSSRPACGRGTRERRSAAAALLRGRAGPVAGRRPLGGAKGGALT